MNKKAMVGWGLFLFLSASAPACSKSDKDKGSDKDKKEDAVDDGYEEVKLTKLLSGVTDDPKALAKKYKGKDVKFTGLVQELHDQAPEPWMSISAVPGADAPWAACTMSSAKKVLKWKVGDKVLVKGTFNADPLKTDVPYISIKKCTLEKDATAKKSDDDDDAEDEKPAKKKTIEGDFEVSEDLPEHCKENVEWLKACAISKGGEKGKDLIGRAKTMQTSYLDGVKEKSASAQNKGCLDLQEIVKSNPACQ